MCKNPIAPSLAVPANDTINLINTDIIFQWNQFPEANVGYPCGSGTFVPAVFLLLDREQDMIGSSPKSVVFNTTTSIFESSPISGVSL